MLTRFAALSIVALGATLVTTLATTVVAQPAGRGMAACRTDTATFCAGIEAGGGRRIACLTANTDKLSAACAATLQQRAAQAPTGASAPAPGAAGSRPVPSAGPTPPPGPSQSPAQTTAPGNPQTATPPAADTGAGPGKGGRRAACRADMKLLCAAVPQGGGAKVRCLQDNQAKLSPICAETLADVKAARKAERSACALDAQTFCPSLKGEQRRACLTENAVKLSPECTTAQSKRAQR